MSITNKLNKIITIIDDDRLEKLINIVDDYREDVENDSKWADFEDGEEKQRLVGKKCVKCPFCGSIVTENRWFDKDYERSRKYHGSITLMRFAYIPEHEAFAWNAACSECNTHFYICIDANDNNFILRSNEVDKKNIFRKADWINSTKPPYIFFSTDFDSQWQDLVRKEYNRNK